MPSTRVRRAAAGGSAAALLAAVAALVAVAMPAAHAADTPPRTVPPTTPTATSPTAPPATAPPTTAPPTTIPPTTPTGPVTPTPPPPGSTCAVDYHVHQRGHAFTATVTLTTTGQANGWLITWDQPSGTQTVTRSWNATVTKTGTTYAARNLDGNAVIPRGGGTVTFGFRATWSGSNPPPAGFVFNSLACTLN